MLLLFSRPLPLLWIKLTTILTILVTLILQFYYSFKTLSVWEEELHSQHQQEQHTWEVVAATTSSSAATTAATKTTTIAKRATQSDGFGACLLMKDDNDLLPEWLAYHYVKLPLRTLVVGIDVNSTQRPEPILDRWRELLDVHILPSESFLHRHGVWNTSSSLSSSPDDHHHGLIHRQKAFLTVCTELLHRLDVQWTIYIDTDEYITFHEWRHDHDVNTTPIIVPDSKGVPGTISNTSFHVRKHWIPEHSTVLSLLQRLQKANMLNSPCYSMPRLLVGALENTTCLNNSNNNNSDVEQFAFSLNTMRFLQHARPGDFSHSKFGKVMMNVSALTQRELQSVPRSIHRPFKSVCGPPVVYFPDAVFFVAHYLGSWDRYSSRPDGRRSRSEWDQRAFLTETGKLSCSDWLATFMAHLGGRARALYFLQSSVGPDLRP